MKKIYTFFAVIATAVLALSCAKETEEQVQPEPKQGSFEYNFRINREVDGDSKTTLDATTVKWEIGDKIGVYSTSTVNASGEIATLNPVVFPVNLNAAITAGTKVYCYYPYAAANDEIAATAVKMSIPADQTGDFDAMPQVSIPFEAPSDMAAGSTDVSDIYFCNLGSVLRFYVYSSGGAYTGETVSSIKFISENALAGSFTFNASAVDYNTPSTLAISGYTAKTLTVTAAPAIGTTTGNAGTVDAVVAPGTYYGKIVVTTDAARYVYTIAEPNKFTVARSAIKKLAVNLESASCTRAAIVPAGTLFVPATSIANGDVLLLTSGNSGTVKAMGYQKDNNRDAVEVVLNNGALISTADMYPVTAVTGKINASYFSLYDGKTDGYLFAASSSSNYLRTQSDNSVDSEWEIVLDENAQATTFQATASTKNKIMRYNSSNSLFNCYASASNNPVYVYKLWTGTYVAAVNKNVANAAAAVEIPYSLYNESGTTTATIKTNPGTCASGIAVDEANHKVTFSITANTGAERTVEINITNNGFTKTVAVTQAAASVTISSLALGSATVEGKVAALCTKGFILADNTGAIFVFENNAPTVSIGQTVTVAGTVAEYHYGLQINSPTVTPGATGSYDPGDPTDVDKDDIDSFNARITSELAQYVRFSGVVNYASSAYKNVVVGGTSVANATVYYLSSSITSPSKGDYVTVTGYAINVNTDPSRCTVVATAVTKDDTKPALVYDNITGVAGAGASNVNHTLTPYRVTGWTPSIQSKPSWVTISTPLDSDCTVITYSAEANGPTLRSGEIVYRLTKDLEYYDFAISISQEANARTETIQFSTLGLSNDTQYTSFDSADPANLQYFTISFGSGANDGKYYTTGTGIRTYGGGTITIASESYTICKIEFTWSGGASYKPSADVAVPTGYNSDTAIWEGSASSVVLTRPSGSGHWRLQKVKVTFSN